MKISYSILLILFFASCNLFSQSKDTITTKSGLKYFILKKGNGKSISIESVVAIHYTLMLSDGSKYESTRDYNSPFVYKPSELIEGMKEALLLMKVGDHGVFLLPYQLAYGEKGIDDIPPKEDLIFDVEIIDVKKDYLKTILLDVLFDESTKKDDFPNIKEVMLKFKELKKQKYSDFHMDQYQLNTIGYKLIKKYPKQALEIFKLNVEEYPNEANPYDSLGECYIKLKQNDMAIKSFKKALKIDPKKKSSIKFVKELTENNPAKN